MVSLIERLSYVAGVVAAFLIAVAIAIVCQMVVIRYALQQSAAWQTEVVTFSLVAATLLGSPWVMKKRGHVAVELVTSYADPAAQRIMRILADLVVMIFALIMFWEGLELTLEAYEGGWTTDSIYEFSIWIPYSSMPIGFGLLALQCLACILKTISGQDEPRSGGH